MRFSKMKSIYEKSIIGICAIVIGWLSSRIDINQDFLWSIRGRVLPLLVALLSLYCTLSINLVKTLDEFTGRLRVKALKVISSMKYELRWEFWCLVVVFILMVLFPVFSRFERLSFVLRWSIDSLSLVAVVLFLITILDTFFSYLDIIQLKKDDSLKEE